MKPLYIHIYMNGAWNNVEWLEMHRKRKRESENHMRKDPMQNGGWFCGGLALQVHLYCSNCLENQYFCLSN